MRLETGYRIHFTALKVSVIVTIVCISIILAGQISMEYQTIPGESGDLELRGDTLFAVAGNALEIYDVSSNSFNLINRIYFNDVLYDIQLQDSLIFISYAYQKGIEVFNAKDPLNLIKITNINLRRVFAISDTILFGLANGKYWGEDTLKAFNISDIRNPVFVSEYTSESEDMGAERLSIIDTIVFPKWTFADIYNIKRTTFSDNMYFENVEMIDETLGIVQYYDSDKILCIYNFKNTNSPALVDTLTVFEYNPGKSEVCVCTGDSLIFINHVYGEENDFEIRVYDFTNPFNVVFKGIITNPHSVGQKLLKKLTAVNFKDDKIYYSSAGNGLYLDSICKPFSRIEKHSTGNKYSGGKYLQQPLIKDSVFISPSLFGLYTTNINIDEDTFKYHEISNFLDYGEIYNVYPLGDNYLLETSFKMILLDSDFNVADEIYGSLFAIPFDDYFYMNDGGWSLYHVDSLNKINLVEEIEELEELTSYFYGYSIVDSLLLLKVNYSIHLYDITNLRHPIIKSSVRSIYDYEQVPKKMPTKKHYLFDSYFDGSMIECSIYCYDFSKPDSIKKIWTISVLDNKYPDSGNLIFVNDYLVCSFLGDYTPDAPRNVVYDVSNPENPVFVDTMDIFPFGAGFGIRNYLYGSTYACGYNRIKFGEVKQELTTDGAHDFGTITKNDSLIETHAVINTGGDVLTVDSVKGLSRAFSVIGSLPINISPSDTGYIVFKFFPDSAGKFSDTAFVYSNDIYAIYHKIGLSGESEILSLIENDDIKPKEIRNEYLEINGSEIVYSNLKKGNIEITVYDISGREIMTMTEALKTESGKINMKQFIKKAGIYFIRAEMSIIKEKKKVLIF
ncbi:MAG: T9SS type A sorting domain-containing protein [bacterium]|nr:T9SS type A sorting domain-containing protein [bacterium]